MSARMTVDSYGSNRCILLARDLGSRTNEQQVLVDGARECRDHSTVDSRERNVLNWLQVLR